MILDWIKDEELLNLLNIQGITGNQLAKFEMWIF